MTNTPVPARVRPRPRPHLHRLAPVVLLLLSALLCSVCAIAVPHGTQPQLLSQSLSPTTTARYSQADYERKRRRRQEERHLAERRRIQHELRRHRDDSERFLERLRGLKEKLRIIAERKRHEKDQRRDNPEKDSGHKFTFLRLTLETATGPRKFILNRKKILRVFCIVGSNGKKCLDHAESVRFDNLAKQQRDDSIVN